MAGRCYPLNAMCLCASCHATFTDAPTEWGRFVIKTIGEGQYEILRERINMIFKYSKSEKNKIAQHYREEYARLRKLRKDGQQGFIPIIGYD